MLFAKTPKIRKHEAALIARTMVMDFMESDEDIESWILRSDATIEGQVAGKGRDMKPSREASALIFRQALYFLTSYKAQISAHMNAMAAHRKLSESGGCYFIGRNMAAYLDELPYLQKFKQ